MTTTTGSAPNKEKGWFNRFLSTVEFLGNMLPHPITLFALFCLAIILFSGIASWFGLSAIDPRPIGAAGREADGVIEVVSLLTAEGLQMNMSIYTLLPASLETEYIKEVKRWGDSLFKIEENNWELFTLKEINYSYYENFITNYKASNVNSFKEFSIWLSERIRNDYSKNKLVFIENIFLSETEVSLLIIKYA